MDLIDYFNDNLLLNKDVLMKFTRGNKELSKKNLIRFLSLCNIIKKAKEKNDVQLLMSEVHKLKGIAGYLGSDNLNNIVEELNRKLKKEENYECDFMLFELLVNKYMESLNNYEKESGEKIII